MGEKGSRSIAGSAAERREFRDTMKEEGVGRRSRAFRGLGRPTGGSSLGERYAGGYGLAFNRRLAYYREGGKEESGREWG